MAVSNACQVPEIVEGQARKHRLQDVAPINFDQLKVQRLLFQAVQAVKEILRLEFFNSFSFVAACLLLEFERLCPSNSDRFVDFRLR